MSDPVSKEYLNEVLDKKIDEVLEAVQVGFTDVNRRFDRLENRVEDLEEKSDKQFEILRRAQDAIDRQGGELKEHREKLDLHDSRLSAVEARGK